MVTWRSSPTIIRIGGEPISPLASTSQPAASSTLWRAAASAVKFAIWQLVTSPYETCSGSPNSSTSHAPHTSSTTEAAGAAAYSPAFWSHAEVSQSAARAAGRLPPMTNPKNRPPGVAMIPGSAALASSATTICG